MILSNSIGSRGSFYWRFVFKKTTCSKIFEEIKKILYSLFIFSIIYETVARQNKIVNNSTGDNYHIKFIWIVQILIFHNIFVSYQFKYIFVERIRKLYRRGYNLFQPLNLYYLQCGITNELGSGFICWLG